MRHSHRWLALAAALLLASPLAAAVSAGAGAPPVASFSALAFAPDGTLFVGDARAGALLALDLGERPRKAEAAAVELADVEAKLAALLGTTAADVLVHDLAVDPIAHDVYVAVSRNRGKWALEWNLPNDLGDASELVRLRADGRLEGVDLGGVKWSRVELPKPVAPGTKHPWKEGTDLRTEAITDLAWDDGTLWVAGLSNEEFSSAIWRVAYPFSAAPVAITTVENYHVAHGKWETEAPVRTLVPLEIGGKKHLVAAYLCTPLVLFETASLVDGAHVRGRTVAEFGSGNYPLDIVQVANSRGRRLMLANSNLPLLVVDVAELERFEGALAAPVESYTAGVPAQYRASSGIQQLDLIGGRILLMLKRTPRGTLDLTSWPLQS
jgi:hypothetical protein